MSEFEHQIRYGGPQAEEEDEAKRKAEERERKKAEVRKRLEEQGKAGKKAKKGFLTPERKKKLRKLLMMKAAEDLKQQQLLKEKERQQVLAERTIKMPAVDTIDDHGKLQQIYHEMWARVCTLEEEKYDINQLVLASEAEINELTIAVNDLRGKFVKPSLKKVSKYDNKFKKMAEQGKKEDKTNLRSNLKVVKKENVFTQLANKKKENKPDWSNKNKDSKKEEKDEKEEDVVIPSNESAADEVKEEEIHEEEEEDEEEEEEEEEEE